MRSVEVFVSSLPYFSLLIIRTCFIQVNVKRLARAMRRLHNRFWNGILLCLIISEVGLLIYELTFIIVHFCLTDFQLYIFISNGKGSISPER
jgi:hypothetical protein